MSRSKSNHGEKFCQLIKYNVRNIFLKIDAENVARKLVPDLFLFFNKTLYKVKASGHHTSVFHPYLCVSIHPCMHLCYVCILCIYTVHYLVIILCCMPMHACFVCILCTYTVYVSRY